MSKNTSIIKFGQFLHESWAFESGHLLKNQIILLDIQLTSRAYTKLLQVAHVLLIVFMKVATLVVNLFKNRIVG